jgi:UDP-glucose 4-epimerase
MRIEGSKILVTGGAGFIGSHIVEELLALGASVTVYDNFSFGNYENLSGFRDDVRIEEGDILDFDRLERAIKGHDIVSHHAAQLEIFLSVEDPYRDLEINTIGTLNVLRAAKLNQVSKVLNASSACIYGQTEAKTSEDYLPVPNWAYGVSKLAAERYGTIYSRYHELPVVNLRYGITYGEREWFRRVLPIFIKRAIIGETLVVFGEGRQVRDFVYVKDAVRLHNICIENESANGECYNVGTGTPTKIVSLAHLVSEVAEEILGNRVTVIHEETEEGEFSKIVPNKRRNPAELKMMLLDPAKTNKELNWKAEITLREGIKRELIWASKNLHRWENIHYS